jgi:hypothetical protein
LLLQGVDFVCQSLGLARQAPARQCAPVANWRNILWPPAHSTYGSKTIGERHLDRIRFNPNDNTTKHIRGRSTLEYLGAPAMNYNFKRK